MADVAPGIRDAIGEAISEVEKTAPETAAVVPAEIPVADEGAEAVETSTEGRKRGPDGKFLPKEGDEAPAETAEGEKKPPEGDEPAKDEKAAAETLPDATARWSEADKAMFKTLPKEGQDFLLRRARETESDYTKKTAAIADLKREYEPVDQMFAPFKAQMQQQGWTPSKLIKAWSEVERDLMEGRGADVVARMVRDYKLNPQEIAKVIGLPTAVPSGAGGAAPTAESQATFDPAVEALLDARFGKLVTPLQQQLQALANEATQRQQAQLAEQQRVAEGTVQNFIDAKSADGQALHPHYSEVEQQMVVLARAEREAGRTPDLMQIYEQAVWANPQTREKLLSAQKADQAAKTRQESVAKAAAAKKASSSVTGAPGSGLPPKAKSVEGMSLREQLEAAAADSEAA